MKLNTKQKCIIPNDISILVCVVVGTPLVVGIVVAKFILAPIDN